MHYYQLPEERYIYYECYTNNHAKFDCFINDDPLGRTLFLTSKIIPISTYIPGCFHKIILQYYYDKK
jgi:hypothetical protein